MQPELIIALDIITIFVIVISALRNAFFDLYRNDEFSGRPIKTTSGLYFELDFYNIKDCISNCISFDDLDEVTNKIIDFSEKYKGISSDIDALLNDRTCALTRSLSERESELQIAYSPGV